MVQKKVPNRLGIQADHGKSEKGLINLKSSSSQHQDGKNLKKKMKKSRSIKRSDFESLRSIQQPGKPPTLDVPNTAPIPRKQSPVKSAEASPNYMKSTSSFEARKERNSPVSSRNSQASISAKTPSPKNLSNLNLKHSSARTLNRTSSLKLVRTLTKSPSFKPSRTKCSPVVLCEDIDAQRSTCSSTLKNSKFPNYLELNPGATESEGTSVMKVCPYTYCSLNGHHHPPLPPLKCFLSARRRMLKTQKSIKLGCLSPRRAKPSGGVIFSEKPAIQELDLESLPISPMIQEEQKDFFIEIYGKEREDTDETGSFSVNEIMPSVKVCDETASEVEYNLDRSRDGISTEMDITELFIQEDQNEEAAEEVYPPTLPQEVESPPRIQQDELDSEGSDMEWEAGQYSEPYLDDVPIFKSDAIVSSCFKEISTDEVLQGFFDEESVSSEAWFNDGESESGGSSQHLETYVSLELKTTEEIDENTESDEPLGTESTWASIDYPIEEMKATSEDTKVVPEATIEIPTMDLHLGDDETKCTSDAEDEAFIDHQENEESNSSHDSSEQDHNKTCKDSDTEENFLQQELPTTDPRDGIQTFDSLQGFSEAEQHTTSEDNDGSTWAPIVYPIEELKATSEVAKIVAEANNEIPRIDHQENEESSSSHDSSEQTCKDSETEENFLEQELPTTDPRDGMEEEKLNALQLLVGIQTFDSLQGFSEAEQHITSEDNDESQIGDISKDGESDQILADEGFPDASENHSSDKQSQSNNVVGNKDHSEKDQDEAEKFKTLNSTESENRDQDVEEMEVEYTSKADADVDIRSNSYDDTSNTCKYPKGAIRCKRPVEESEEERKFNPRDPNYLPVELDPEAEKVDLRHQLMDERKNAEEWMVDYALRRAVTSLAPARKRKVALLVEAFETVMPIPKYETHLRHTSAAFSHAMPIQACR